MSAPATFGASASASTSPAVLAVRARAPPSFLCSADLQAQEQPQRLPSVGVFQQQWQTQEQWQTQQQQPQQHALMQQQQTLMQLQRLHPLQQHYWPHPQQPQQTFDRIAHAPPEFLALGRAPAPPPEQPAPVPARQARKRVRAVEADADARGARAAPTRATFVSVASRAAVGDFLRASARAHADHARGCVNTAPPNVRTVSGLAPGRLCGAVPFLARSVHALGLPCVAPGSRARYLYVAAEHEGAKVAGEVARIFKSQASLTAFVAYIDAIERALLELCGEGVVLELAFARATFFVGNAGGRIFVNLACSTTFAQFSGELVAALAHAVSHNRAEHDIEARLIEAALCEELNANNEIAEAHSRFANASGAGADARPAVWGEDEAADGANVADA